MWNYWRSVLKNNYEDQDTKISFEFTPKRASLVDKIQEKVSQTPGLRKVFLGSQSKSRQITCLRKAIYRRIMVI